MKEKFFKSLLIIMFVLIGIIFMFLFIGLAIVPNWLFTAVGVLMIIPMIILFGWAIIAFLKMEEKIDIELERYRKHRDFLDEFIKEQNKEKENGKE